MAKRATISDVATAAGVSVATVSRVLNDGTVKPATASRVWEAAERLEYSPNALTKSIFAGRSSTIGVLIDDLSSPFYLELMHGIDEVADANGSLVMFASMFRHAGREVAQVETMEEQRVRGMIVTTGESSDDRTRRMAARGTPCVVVARSVQQPPEHLHSVALENITAGRMIANHLIACGRRSVAAITSGDRPSQRDRAEGLRQGLAAAGLSLPENAVASVADNSQVSAAVGTLLNHRPQTDALACLSGRRTVAAYSALTTRRVAIPADIGFLTMDDFAWASALGITVVAQPSYQMGQKAAELVVESPTQPAQLTFEPTLITRTSCGEDRHTSARA